MDSLWRKTTHISRRESVEADIRCQNVVIGAGMAGILIAYLLQKKGQEVVVLEAKEIGSGQTQNTTAKITSQHGCIYHKMIQNIGIDKAMGYTRANEAAIQLYKEIVTEEGIACHWEEMPSFLYSQKESGNEALKKETVAAKRLGIKAEYIRGEKVDDLPFGVMGAVKFEGQAQFHPLEFIKEIADKLTIYEHTKVLEVDDHFVITEKHVLVADHVIFATHYPFPIVPGYYFLRQHQSRSYVIAIEGEKVPKSLDGMYYGIDQDGLSFRYADGKLLIGGGSHRTGKKKGKGEDGFCFLRKKINQYYPKAIEHACWAAQDCMPHDGIPFIGHFSMKHENWYVATGFQKWGMTFAMVAAMIISDLICGNKNPYAHVFSPQRLHVRAGYKKLFVDIWESAVGLIKGVFAPKESRCTHMGCALEWNAEERTWDCSCHGSRYEKDGKQIDGPAQSATTRND